MKFISFEITDVGAINQFLEKESDNLAPNSTYYHEGKVCFLYNTLSEEELVNANLEAMMQKMLAEKFAAAIGTDLDTRFWLTQTVLKPQEQQLKMNAVQADDIRVNALKQAAIIQDMIKEVKAGTWVETSKLSKTA